MHEERPLTVGRLFAWAGRQFASRTAIHFDGLSISYAELDALRLKAAKAMFMAGVRKGDCVAIWAPNLPEFIVAAAGMQSIGAILVPLNTRYKAGEAADILNRSRAVMLFTIAEFAGNSYVSMIEEVATPALRQIVLFRGSAHGRAGWPKFIDDGVAAMDAAGPEVQKSFLDAIEAVGPDDYQDLMFTSGTTGAAKGVRLTHRQSIETYIEFSRRLGRMNERDRYLIINPFFHVLGYKGGWLSCVIRGASIHPMEVFEPLAAMRKIQAEKITVMPGPPTIFNTILDHPDRAKFDLSSLRVSLVGSTVIPRELVRRMSGELGIEVVHSGYGLTETSGLVCTTTPGDPIERVAETAGTAIRGMHIRCVDESGAAVPYGTQGEIAVKGFAVLHEYMDDPEGTRNAFTADGYFRTGDLGSIDRAGYLRITGRLKDMFIVGGFNCYPAEIESMLRTIDGVHDVAVIGVPDERLGEVGKACVVPREGAALTAEEVIRRSRELMANFKVPRYVEFVDALPFNPSGKVLKTVLRERHKASSQSSAAPSGGQGLNHAR